MGWPMVERAIDDILTYTQRRLRTRIAALPDGEYRFERSLDDDGFEGPLVPIVCTARIAGDTLELDFDGSGPQARGAVNLPDSALKASVYYCVKAVLDPGPDAQPGHHRPHQDHRARPAPSSIRARRPPWRRAPSHRTACAARCSARSTRRCRPRRAWRPATIPRRRRRSPAGTRAAQATYVYPESMGGGAGAFADSDGQDAVHVHTVNSTNLPVEALELEYPLLLDEYCLVPDSGGAGRHRGGMGMARQIRIREDGTIFSARSDAHLVPAPGVIGGLPSNVDAHPAQPRHARRGGPAFQGLRPRAGGRRDDPRRDAGRRRLRSARASARSTSSPRICARAR